MIRIVYRWRVKPGHEDVFAKAWARGTKAIHATVKRARRSLLLQSQKNPSAFLAVARWDSLENWQAFRRGERPNPEAFRIASAVSEFQSVEAFHEVRDLRALHASEVSGLTAGSSTLTTRPLRTS
jgi:heme-degrading monooxygenase HmoA